MNIGGRGRTIYGLTKESGKEKARTAKKGGEVFISGVNHLPFKEDAYEGRRLPSSLPLPPPLDGWM